MAYLIAQIFVCLLLAALLGGLVGWLLRGRRAAVPDADALAVAQRRVEELERERASFQTDRQSAPVATAMGGAGEVANAAGRISRDEPDPPPADL